MGWEGPGGFIIDVVRLGKGFVDNSHMCIHNLTYNYIYIYICIKRE